MSALPPIATAKADFRTPLDRLLRTRNVIHVVDDDSAEPDPGAAATLGGARARASAVPMLKDNELVGAILIYRRYGLSPTGRSS